MQGFEPEVELVELRAVGIGPCRQQVKTGAEFLDIEIATEHGYAHELCRCHVWVGDAYEVEDVLALACENLMLGGSGCQSIPEAPARSAGV